MSDLEKFLQLFGELGIKYSLENNKISIDNIHIIEESYLYGKALDITFSDDGRFVGFEPWGE